MPSLGNLSIPWCLFEDEDDIQDLELHTLSVASEEAFVAVEYLRTTYKDTPPRIRLIVAKTKIAPKKTISVAKLELHRYCGARPWNYIGKAFTRNIDRRYSWTDSSWTRNWITSPVAMYKPFVNHHSKNIHTTRWNGRKKLKNVDCHNFSR